MPCHIAEDDRDVDDDTLELEANDAPPGEDDDSDDLALALEDNDEKQEGDDDAGVVVCQLSLS